MNICKKIISTICASVFVFSCFGFNTFAEDTDDLIYPVLVEWEATSNTDGTQPIKGTINANIIISPDRHSVKLVTTENFEVWFPVKIISTLDNFVYGKCEKYCYLGNLKTTENTYKEGNKTYSYYGIDTGTQSSFIIKNIKYTYSRDFEAGSVISENFTIYNIQTGGGIEYYMRDTEYCDYGDERDQYIKQLEEENAKLKNEIASFNKMDYDADGMLTNADAQMILIYYTDSLVGNASGKVSDYADWISKIEG